MLFGLWEARGALASGARPVIVEGPLDAIAVTTAGHGRYAGVAPCGTALTGRQVAALAQAADLRATGVLVAFDPDQAGRRAAVHAYHLLIPLTDNLTAVTLPSRAGPSADPGQIRPRRPRRDAHRARPGRSPTWSSTRKSPGGAAGCATPKARSTPCAPPLP